MEFLQLAEQRYSVRKFEDRPIAQEAIESILKAGHFAPTACNNQPQRVLVITEPAALERLRRCTSSHFHAPAALLVCYDSTRCWVREYDGKLSGEIDASIVATHMMLQAAAIGVGSTWVMHFIPEAIREEFSVPETLEPVALLVMGYPAKDAKPYPGHSSFRPESDIVSCNAF